MDLSDQMTEVPFSDVDSKAVRQEARRNRSCRDKDSGGNSRPHSRHHHNGAKSCERSCERNYCSNEDGKENFLVPLIPCTPRTPRTKATPRPLTVAASPQLSSAYKSPRSPPSCLITTLPATTPKTGKLAAIVDDLVPHTTLSPSRSVDSQLNNLSVSVNTPVAAHSLAGGSIDTEMDRIHLHVDTPCMKSASKKSVFGSLERSMDRLLCMLTPKKKRSSPSFDQPRIVKAMHNVSNTSRNTPDEVLLKLKSAIELRKLACRQAGYTLRCTMTDDWGKVRLAFDLEVVLVSVHKVTLTGIYRKRVKGDAWHYKKLCEDLLSVATVELH